MFRYFLLVPNFFFFAIFFTKNSDKIIAKTKAPKINNKKFVIEQEKKFRVWLNEFIDT